MIAATRRLLEEQLVVAVLGSGKKSDAMWDVPQNVSVRTQLNTLHEKTCWQTKDLLFVLF